MDVVTLGMAKADAKRKYARRDAATAIAPLSAVFPNLMTVPLRSLPYRLAPARLA